MNPDWRIVEHDRSGLCVRTCRLLGEGWNSYAYCVNEDLVFRFPKRAECWEELRREMAFLDAVGHHLPQTVPRYLATAPESPASPHGYAVYRYIQGETFDVRRLSARQKGAAADALATFLKALHTFVPPPEVAAILSRESPHDDVEEYRQIAGTKVVPQLTPLQADALRAACNQYIETLGHDRKAVPLHADLSREHILPTRRAISGVIDFGDVNLGDADYDFMYLCLDYGWEFAEAVALRYDHPDRERLQAKLRYFAIVDQIDTIAHGEGLVSDGQVRQAWGRLRQILDAESGV
jgi:aminoglycoside 2''-phosphotransferase